MAKPTKAQLVRRVRTLVTIGFLVSLGIVYTGMYYVDISVPKTSHVTDRLVFAIRYLPLSLIPLVLNIIVVARTRRANIETVGYDPSQVHKDVEKRQRVLQNTLEQTLVHIVVILAISSYQDGDGLKMIPILVFAFLCGRVIFIIGYLCTDNAINRGMGFAMTFLPNVLGTLYCVYSLFTRGATSGIQGE